MKFTLITVATEEVGYYKVLKETAKIHGYELVTLGLGKSGQVHDEIPAYGGLS